MCLWALIGVHASITCALFSFTENETEGDIYCENVDWDLLLERTGVQKSTGTAPSVARQNPSQVLNRNNRGRTRYCLHYLTVTSEWWQEMQTDKVSKARSSGLHLAGAGGASILPPPLPITTPNHVCLEAKGSFLGCLVTTLPLLYLNTFQIFKGICPHYVAVIMHF